ncbi:helix-turn-helix transcriptional regulator [Actinoplanes sp. LDG1-06]|uniref:Helix-turn-helix transcriptional regulator n=1 Tax=Paractinoplanes ovalisporus TaxID=2810368 RepID=A0ABS2AQ23_9ACTN|nr:helix-turn-helix domain-containing protein [Actinoplanes ovalisporus]MBM2621941.1 helix-turn-helix transcriptional regulator [Actinoplanes ovalisporus]
MRNLRGQVFLADCPTRLAVEIITEKWAVIVLFALSLGPQRPGEMADLIGGISGKVLTQTLRRLQGYGLVERHAYAEAPPRVEYSLTDLGQTLVEPIKMLTDWARDNGEAIVDFQEQQESGQEQRESSQAQRESGQEQRESGQEQRESSSAKRDDRDS